MRFVRSLLVFVFFLSGMDGLIYQVAWQRLLTVYYGVGPISTALIVTIFMLGLGVGALCGGALRRALFETASACTWRSSCSWAASAW